MVGGAATAPILAKNEGFNATMPISSNAISMPKLSATESETTTAVIFNAGKATSVLSSWPALKCLSVSAKCALNRPLPSSTRFT